MKRSKTPDAGNESSKYYYDLYQNYAIRFLIYALVIVLSVRQLENGQSHSGYGSNASSTTMQLMKFPSQIQWYLLIGLTGIALLCLSLDVQCFLKRRRLPPGDPGWPILGCIVPIMKNNRIFFTDMIRKYGPISSYNILTDIGIVLTEDEDIQWVITQERKGLCKSQVLPHWMDLLGPQSIQMQSGESHRRLRKVFEPAFSPSAIKDYATVIDETVQIQLEKWCKSGQYQSPREWALLAMRIFFVCAFGQADEKRMEKLTCLFEGWVVGFQSFSLRIPGLGLARAHDNKRQLFELLKEMIDEFKAENPPPQRNDNTGKRESKISSSRIHSSILGRLCYAVDENGNPPSEQILLDNLLVFMFAGFDTTKASFGAIFHYLKKNSRAEDVLTEEVQALGGLAINVDQLKYNSPILNAVMAETWRLTPPLVGHTTCATVDLEYKGYYIPKGTYVVSDIYGNNVLNEKRFPGAFDFHFERWLPEDHPLFDNRWANQNEKIDYNVMSTKFRSFNMGPHMCLGGHFAKMEVRIVVARLLQQYTVELRNEKVLGFPFFQITSEFKVIRRSH